MRVSLFGLGYVGCVTAACLAKCDHEAWGVDVSADKVAMVNAGKSPITERGLAELIAAKRDHRSVEALPRQKKDFRSRVDRTDRVPSPGTL